MDGVNSCIHKYHYLLVKRRAGPVVGCGNESLGTTNIGTSSKIM